MTNTEIAKLISRDTEISIEDVKLIINTFSKYVCMGLLKGEEVHIGKLGKLKFKMHKAREVQNFQTNERYVSKPFYKPHFSPSQTVSHFVEKLNESLLLANEDSGI